MARVAITMPDGLYHRARLAELDSEIVPRRAWMLETLASAPGEVARHIPKVWHTTTPEAAIAARQRSCVKALRRILGHHIGSPASARGAHRTSRARSSP